MKFVLRKATKSGSNNPIKPRPKTGYIPFELRGVDISTGGPAKLIDALKQTSISKKLFHEPSKTSQRMNGISAFVPSITKLTFLYNFRLPSSQLLMLYIQKTLPSFAQAHSHIEIAVSSQTRHAAYIIAQYSNMRVKEIDASLIGEKGIVRRVEELAYESGIEAGTVFGPVRSTKEYGKRLDAFHDPNFFRP